MLNITIMCVFTKFGREKDIVQDIISYSNYITLMDLHYCTCIHTKKKSRVLGKMWNRGAPLSYPAEKWGGLKPCIASYAVAACAK